MQRLHLFAVPLLLSAAGAAAQAPTAEPSHVAVEQLRHTIGTWNSTTEFIAPDGTVSGRVQGQYRFEWVLRDRIVSGVSTIPELNQVSGLLLFVRPSQREVEMVSVGADGQLWRMIGPEDGATRTTPDTPMADGSTMMLRFTRHDVTPDSFHSRVEISTDGGATWQLGNRQHFTRAERG